MVASYQRTIRLLFLVLGLLDLPKIPSDEGLPICGHCVIEYGFSGSVLQVR